MHPQPLEPGQRANHRHHADAPLSTAPHGPEPERLADQTDNAGPALELHCAALREPDSSRAKDGEGGLNELIGRHPTIVHYWIQLQCAKRPVSLSRSRAPLEVGVRVVSFWRWGWRCLGVIPRRWRPARRHRVRVSLKRLDPSTLKCVELGRALRIWTDERAVVGEVASFTLASHFFKISHRPPFDSSLAEATERTNRGKVKPGKSPVRTVLHPYFERRFKAPSPWCP